MKNTKIKLSFALLWILFSIVLISGSAWTGFFLFRKWGKEKKSDKAYNIAAIVQTGPQKEVLKTAFLAELLGLSVDQPINLFAFDKKEGEKKLLATPLIKEAKIAKIPPTTLYIDYTARQPVARLFDYENVAVDREGYLFPIVPFLTPKELPEIYLGLTSLKKAIGSEEILWKEPLRGKPLEVALELLFLLTGPGPDFHETLRLVRIDTSQILSPHYGKREIVLIFEDELWIEQKGRKLLCLFPYFLRLDGKEYLQQLCNFFSLVQQIRKDYRKQIVLRKKMPTSLRFLPKIIDLRISHIALIGDSTKESSSSSKLSAKSR